MESVLRIVGNAFDDFIGEIVTSRGFEFLEERSGFFRNPAFIGSGDDINWHEPLLAAWNGACKLAGETIFGDASDSGQSLKAFAFRQSDSSNNETVTVDNLVITTNVHKLSSVLLSGVALLGLLRRRR